MARGRGKAAALRVAIDLTVEAGEWPGEAELDWAIRHRNMRAHTLMHLLCACVPFPVTGGAIGEDGGNHGDESKAGRPSGVRIYDPEGQVVADLDVGPTHWMAIDSHGDIYTATHRAVNKLVRL